MTFLIFAFILGLLIMVHEAGHFFMARRLGVRVEEFAFGFGPKLWGWKKGDTEYRVCAIPLGGYVKMAGDEKSHCQGARDEFFSQSSGHRALIVLMGPVVNYFLAYLCFVLMFLVGAVDLDASSKAVPARVGKVMAGSVAEKAGMKPGDVVVTVNGTAIVNWVAMQDMVLASGGKSLKFVVNRAGQKVEFDPLPKLEVSRDNFGREHQVARIGVQARELSGADHFVVRRYGFPDAVRKGAEELWSVTSRTCVALGEIITGRRSAKEGVTGVIGIFFIVKFALSIDPRYLLYIVGVISASLAIFNVLPLVPLDGGHLALLGLEKVRGRALSVRAEDIIAKGGFALFIALALFVFYVDFERIGLIDKVVGFFR